MTRPSKEFVVLALALLVAAAGLWSALRGETPEDAKAAPRAAARAYAPPRRPYAPFVARDFGPYAVPRDITKIKRDVVGVSLDDIPLPPPPAPVLAAPRLRPWPGTAGEGSKGRRGEPENRGGGRAPAPPARSAKPPPRPMPLAAPKDASGAPVAAGRPLPEHLPAPADLDALLKLPPPADDEIPDRRAEKLREYDRIVLKAGNAAFEGTILNETAADLIFQHKTGPRQTIARGDIAQIDRGWTMAQQYAADAAAAPPADAAAHARLGAWCFERGMVPEALAEYGKAAAIAPGDAPIALKLAALLHRAGNFNAELETYRRAAEKGASGRDQILLALGDFFRTFGLLPEALRAYEEAAKLQATSVEAAWASAAETALALGRPGDALDDAAAALKWDAKSPRAHVVRAQVAFARGDLAAARGELQGVGGTGPLNAAAQNLLGVINFIEGAHAEAVQCFARAAQADPAQTTALTNLGIVCLLAGKPDEAQGLFALAAGRDPADALPAAGLALAAALQAQAAAKPPAAPDGGADANKDAPADAAAPKGPDPRALFEKAWAVDPNEPYAGYGLGLAAGQAQDLARAEEYLRAAVRGDPDGAPALYALGCVLLAVGRAEEAEVCFWRVAERGDATPEERVALALARCARGDMARGEEELQAIQSQFPRLPSPWSALAWIDYLHHHNAQAAIAKLNEARNIAPADAWTAAVLARIQEAASKTLWEDRFERPDGDEAGNLWFDGDNNGIEIRTADKRCVFSGVQSLGDWADTLIEREVASENFLQFEAELDFSKLSGAVAGLRVAYSPPAGNLYNGVYLVRDERGRLCFSAHSSNVLLPPWKEVKEAVPPLPGAAPGVVRFAIIRPPAGDRAQEFHFYINGVKVGSVETQLRDQAPRYKLAVFTRAVKKTKVEFAVDNVRVYERKSENR